MKIHLLSGFLGSGKTTAIANAAVGLMQAGKRVGVITNDQGKYLVDSKFINSKGIPVVEVSNGCFCCNYETLDKHIIALDKTQAPDYIFAESVGSCTDIIATVLKPLQAYRSQLFDTISLSTFGDARMLVRYLKKQTLPFSEEVNYIIQKQYEEADILVANKADLLKEPDILFLKQEIKKAFPDKVVLFQNSHKVTEVENWVQHADLDVGTKGRKSLEINYERYGKGEANLGWLDQNIVIEGIKAMQGVQFLADLIYQEIISQKKSIGHLKFIISDGSQTCKRSYTSFDENLSIEKIRSSSEKVELLINARIEASPEDLKQIIKGCITQTINTFNVKLETTSQDAFVPGFPNPKYQLV